MALRKKEYSPTWLSEESEKIMKRLEEMPLFQASSCIALYHSLPDEVRTSTFIEKWYTRKTILLPVVKGEDIDLIQCKSIESLEPGCFGIMEPVDNNANREYSIDLMIVPGIAFDRKGNRLGRGKGFYDRLLSESNFPCIGICYPFQLLDQIPTEPFDKKMNGIITSEEFIIINL